MATKKAVKLGSAKPTKTTKFDYHLEIELNNGVHKVDTNDLYQALLDFKNGPTFPSAVKSKVIFRYSKDGKTKEKYYLNASSARQLFFSNRSLELLAKRMTKELPE